MAQIDLVDSGPEVPRRYPDGGRTLLGRPEDECRPPVVDSCMASKPLRTEFRTTCCQLHSVTQYSREPRDQLEAERRVVKGDILVVSACRE